MKTVKNIDEIRKILAISDLIAPKYIVVLGGGWSEEREISLESASGVIQALKNLGHHVDFIDPDRDLAQFVQQIKNSFNGRGNPDLVFNILHGRYGEDGMIQTVLDFLSLRYTFSPALASALAMNKHYAYTIAKTCGVKCPHTAKLSIKDYHSNGWDVYPHVIKPINGGSTIGVMVVKNEYDQRKLMQNWHNDDNISLLFGDELLVQEYIPGRDIFVPVFDGVAVGTIETIFTDNDIFGYEEKYSAGKAQHVTPADISTQARDVMFQYAVRMHNELGCQGMTRTDFRYKQPLDDILGDSAGKVSSNATGQVSSSGIGKILSGADAGDVPGAATTENPSDTSVLDASGVYWLEINTQPGFTKVSLIPDTLAYYGYTYDHIVQWNVEHALKTAKK